MTGAEELQRENEVTLYAVQALLGLISADMTAVVVRVQQRRVELIFWVRCHTSDLDEDVDQAVFDLDALFPEDHPLIEARVIEGVPEPEMLRSYGRMIYWAKP